MRHFILSNLILLGLWSAGDCSRIILEASSHVKGSNGDTYAHDIGGSRFASIALELPKKRLMAFNLEDYNEMEAPPRQPEATHGPVVFFRRKRRGKLPP
eukprot:c29447_g1_i1 orf=141-437(+)